MSNEIKYIETSKLEFDPENPRFYRLNDRAGSDTAVIEEMLDDESVQDLMLSIGEQGYFPGEPLLVVKKGKKFVVVEGNRRLAAVKLLNGDLVAPKKKEKSVQIILDEALQKPQQLPCLVYDNREDVLRYIGYRHITGVKEWDSLSKAKYLKELSDTFYQGVDKDTLFKSLAKEIGSKPYYVGLLLTSLHLYEVAADADFFDLPMKEKDVDFSYITTSLGYKNITSWLGLEDRTDLVANNLDLDNLNKLFAWFFVRDQQGETIIGESRAITKLNQIVAHDSAIENLIKSKNIEEAYLYTNGQEEALEKALEQAETSLKVVWDMLLKTAKFTERQESHASEIANISRKIKRHIEDVREDYRDVRKEDR
ncbi:TPA: ParB N-terminal domain-containing protein [Citrobacter koseri]